MMDLNKDMFVIKGKNVEQMETISRPSLSFWQDAWRRFRKNRAAFVGLCIILVYVLLAIFAPMLSKYGFSTMDAAHQHAAPSAAHWFGTDATGRDQWVRTWMGARVSLSIGLFAATINMCVGAVIGGFCGFYGGKLDMILMRLMDIQMAIPTILMAIVISSVLGPGLFNLMVAVGITYIPKFARLTRASVLSIKDQEFIEAARAMGASHKRIICLYILPNCAAPLIVQSTLSVANAILFAATLSFLGLGIQPPYPEWGGMLSSARPYLRNNAYMSIFPGLAIMFTILSLNFLGDGLRDALDPKQKR